MKKVFLFMVFMAAGAMTLFAQENVLIEEPSNLLQVIASIVGAVVLLTGLGAWFVKKGFGVIAGKIENGLEKTALAMEGAAVVARSAGLEKIATWTEEFADIPDQAGDVFAKLEEMTKNQDFTKERIMELYNEGREVVVEAKDFIMVVKKKELPTE